MSTNLRKINSGDLLFEEGQSFDGLYFIKEGKVEIYRKRESLEVNLGFSGPGDVLGTVTLFSRENRTASARATTETIVQHLPTQTLDVVMKQVPVWVVAVLKDTIARLKFVDEKLVETSVREKKLQTKLGTALHHTMQFAHLLASFINLKTIEEEGLLLFPLKGISARSEAILRQPGNYFEKLLECLNKSGLCQVIVDKKHGQSILSPKASFFEDFGQFCARTVKTGHDQFIPTKYASAVSSLLRIHRRSEFKFPVLKEDLEKIWVTELGRNLPTSIVSDLTELKIFEISEKDHLSFVTFSPTALQKRLVFESCVRLVLEVTIE